MCLCVFVIVVVCDDVDAVAPGRLFGNVFVVSEESLCSRDRLHTTTTTATTSQQVEPSEKFWGIDIHNKLRDA